MTDKKNKSYSELEINDIKIYNRMDPRNSQFDRSMSRMSQSKFLPTDTAYSPDKFGKMGGLK